MKLGNFLKSNSGDITISSAFGVSDERTQVILDGTKDALSSYLSKSVITEDSLNIVDAILSNKDFEFESVNEIMFYLVQAIRTIEAVTDVTNPLGLMGIGTPISAGRIGSMGDMLALFEQFKQATKDREEGKKGDRGPATGYDDILNKLGLQ